MKKTAEQEVQIKLAVRDIIARKPVISGSSVIRIKPTTGKPSRLQVAAQYVRMARGPFFLEAVASRYPGRFQSGRGEPRRPVRWTTLLQGLVKQGFELPKIHWIET
jgi:hypothetical protein